MDKKHLLLVDDDINLLNTLEFVLKSANYDVTTAANGQEALETILTAKGSNHPIDLLLTDIRMPRLTGLQLIDEVNRCNGKIPIIVISAYQDKELVTALKGRGCADFLDKIPDEEELVRRIDLVLRKGV